MVHENKKLRDQVQYMLKTKLFLRYSIFIKKYGGELVHENNKLRDQVQDMLKTKLSLRYAIYIENFPLLCEMVKINYPLLLFYEEARKILDEVPRKPLASRLCSKAKKCHEVSISCASRFWSSY